MSNSIERSPLELDYLRLNANLRAFDATNGKHRRLIINYLENAGLERSKSGGDWIFFENKDIGIKAFFSNFPMNDRKLGRKPTLSIDFTGHYFIRKNSYEASRKMILFFIKKFGAFFNVSRVDIRQDIYDAKYPFDYFPNYTNQKTELTWALRGQPEFRLHYEDPTHTATAFSIKTSRYKIQSYNRIINLKKKLKKNQLTQEYYDYYMDIYQKRDVQRLEITILQDSCKIFAMLFFSSDYSKEKVLSMTMANFGRNHALKILDKSKPLHKMTVSPKFSELFYLDDKEEVKYFKINFEKKMSLKFSEVLFSENGRSFQEVVKMLTKKICELSKGQKDVFNEYKEKTFQLIAKLKSDFFDKPINRVSRYRAGMLFLDLDPDEMKLTQSIIHSRENLEVYV